MSSLRAAMTGFDIAPRFHPQYGAWGTTPVITEVDLPLLVRCLALEQDGRPLVWFAIDLCGENVAGTDAMRDEVAAALGLGRDQVLWSTSQTHSSPTIPGSSLPGGSCITVRGKFDPEFCNAERRRFLGQCVSAAREALGTLRPARVRAGRGHCDTISYNTRFPMPAGGCKFSRNYAEGVQGGKYFDPTVGLVRFDGEDGRAIGAIFNFCCHPATMINDKYLSSDYVGTARRIIEEAIGGAPAMYVQGFCGDVHNYYMFTGPAQARLLGERLGLAALAGLRAMVPLRGEPLRWAWRRIELPCRPMWTREELDEKIAARRAFQEEVKSYPHACWVDGVNVPEFFTAEQKTAFVEVQIAYCREGLRMLEAGESPRRALPLTIGALRVGDVCAAISPGENFAETGCRIRERSPCPHTLICGDTNGLFGYIGTDPEIDRGGYETYSYWLMLYTDGFRTPLAKGTADRVIRASIDLLREVEGG